MTIQMILLAIGSVILVGAVIGEFKSNHERAKAREVPVAPNSSSSR